MNETEATCGDSRPAPILTRLSDVERRPMDWLWPGKAAKGKITLFYGDPGLGKSLVTLDIAARISRGLPWPDGSGDAPVGSVLLYATEDGLEDTICPRLDAMNADDTKIVQLSGVRYRSSGGKVVQRPFSLEDIEELRQAIQFEQDCRLVVIDPLSEVLANVDSHKNAEVRALLGPLAALAEETNVAMLLVSHLNKSGGNALSRISGSIGFGAVARAAWAIAADRDDPDRRLFVPAKNNLAKDSSGLAFRITGETPVIEWEPEPVHIRANEALAIEPVIPGPEPVARKKAEDWLKEQLAIGPVAAEEVKAKATDGGISSITLRRAKEALNVQSVRTEAGHFEWQLN
jgi:putative DNA primase/helicase